MSGQVRAVIFDLDGVLVSTDAQHFAAWSEIARQENVPFSQKDNDRLRGVSRMESLELLLGDRAGAYTPQRKQELAAQKNQRYQQLIRALSPADVLPGVTAFLQSLRAAGIRLAVGSSSRNADTILEKTGLTGWFDAIVTGNHIQRSKPDPEVYQKAAAALGLLPAQCLVVEDARAGVDAALFAGMDVLGVGDAQFYEKSTVVRNNLDGLCWEELARMLSERAGAKRKEPEHI
ncbi:beta-phosphoglucomutase [uncultured Ruthenibacterium sp.]|mgnify:FL=1|uniref:beta-phosphoglucomutase n=1 Tax=uncultured Ruthenibacterium sp. TaxID=1905347 RepID=UPI00349E7313